MVSFRLTSLSTSSNISSPDLATVFVADMGILVPEISYQPAGTVPVPPPATTIFRLALPPMRGPVVQQIQTNLKQKHFDPGVIDGIYGPHTQAAVMSFSSSSA
jgi:peptidoglycan hydrolase-like protein with peptidoglycan-binding domain